MVNKEILKVRKKLDSLEKQPQTQAERKGQISESLRISEKEKSDNEILIKAIIL